MTHRWSILLKLKAFRIDFTLGAAALINRNHFASLICNFIQKNRFIEFFMFFLLQRISISFFKSYFWVNCYFWDKSAIFTAAAVHFFRLFLKAFTCKKTANINELMWKIEIQILQKKKEFNLHHKKAILLLKYNIVTQTIDSIGYGVWAIEFCLCKIPWNH